MSKKSLWTRLNHYFQYRSDRERAALAGVRMLLSFPAIVQRRAAARATAGTAAFTIERTQGFRVFPPHVFPEAREIAAATRDLGQHVDVTRPGLSKKARAGVMVPLIDIADLTLESPILRLALRPDVIAAVSSYLGVVPVLSHVNVHYSAPGGGEPRLSQLLHCDAEATTQIKVFVLCTDVTPAHGPLTLLDAAASRAVRRRVGFHFGNRMKDADKRVARLLVPANLHAVVGEAGTICFADTGQCLHFGSRVGPGAGPRLIAMIQYLPPGSFELPRDHRAAAPFRHLAVPGLTRTQQLVLGAI